MMFAAFDAGVLGCRGATAEPKFGRRVYCVGGRMFASAGRPGKAAPLDGFEASEMAFAHLVEAGLARPMPYLQRARWVQVLRHDALPGEELLAMRGTPTRWSPPS